MSPSLLYSIDDYLQALRMALADADPALIQDALYDAEEHLRAESAAHPEKSEAELLEQIARTYGTPDEVAAAYRDSEAKVAAALSPPISRRDRSANVLSRFFAVYSDSRAYVSLFFMILSLVTGILYFTFAVTGLSLSIELAILIIGLPVGTLYFVTAVTGLAVGLSFLLVPFVSIGRRLGWMVWDDYGPSVFSPAWIDTPAGWVFDVVFGVLVLTTLLHVARAVVAVHARTAKALLVAQG